MIIQPEWLNGIIGFFIPILIQYLKKSNWKRKYKFLVALGSCLIVGLMSSYLTGNFNGKDIFKAIAYIVSISQATYELFWKQLLEGDQSV